MGWDEQFLSIHLNCPRCGTGLPAIEPRSFSFNSPHGACPACQGLGSRRSFQPELVVPDRSRSWDKRAIVPWPLLADTISDMTSYDAPVRDVSGSPWPDRRYAAGIMASQRLGAPSGRESRRRRFAGLAALLEQALSGDSQRIRSKGPRGLSRRCALRGMRRVAAPAGSARGPDRAADRSPS